MRLHTENYVEQESGWPKSGRHILAQYDDDSIVVYQAYRPEIGEFAAKHGYFGGAFSLSRMSGIKPNFLWMMYRSGWAGKEGQEVVLAVRLQRAAFDKILADAVHSSHVPEVYGSREAWNAAGKRSDVRLQWDPDHGPSGAKQDRRAIQLGLRGETLRSYSKEWILDIENVTEFVLAERDRREATDSLTTPRERVYPVADLATGRRLGISEW
jgi:hypothetical protein